MRQERGQLVADFYSQVNDLWEQPANAKPQLKCFEDVELFAMYHDHQKFMHFMMAICEDFWSTRATLLHRTPLPSLDVVVAKLISKENCRSTMKMQFPDIVMVVASLGASKPPPGPPTRRSRSKSSSKNCWRRELQTKTSRGLPSNKQLLLFHLLLLHVSLSTENPS